MFCIEIRTMVKVIQKENRELYQCKECGFYYEDREWALKCEEWCRSHQSCNLHIIQHATGEKYNEQQDGTIPNAH